MKRIVLGLSALSLSLSVHCASYYVAPNGSDKNSGSLQSPFLTVQKGLNAAGPGDTVFLRAGTYREEISFPRSGNAEQGHITLTNQPGETAVLDGVGIAPGKKQETMVLIRDKSFVALKGLIIRNYQTSKKNVVPNGVRVDGAGEEIVIQGNKIHSIKTNYKYKGGNAHALAVYGNRAPQAIRNISITDNELYDLKLGSSEAMVLNGNVDGFLIARNYVHHSNNIGIDVIGFEGTSPNPQFDQARNGVISDNLVHAIASRGNPAYGNSSSAGGIYVDGGRDVVIERNVVYDSDIGIEIASEHKGRSTSKITVRNNLLYSNRMSGIALGGYDSARGKTEDCVIVGNTMYRNNTSNGSFGEIYMQFYTYRNVLKNNIMVAGPTNLFISNRDPSGNVDNILGNNLYFSGNASAAGFKWRNKDYKGLESFQKATGQDQGSFFDDPRFLDANMSNFRLSAQSPALDQGEALGDLAGEMDLDRRARLYGAGPDLGAYELQ